MNPTLAKEKSMSDLAVIAYKGEDTADQVLNKVTEMQKEYLVDLEDAGVLIRDKKGKIRIKQSVPLTRIGALGGATWGAWIGALAGLLMLNPLLGFAAGAAVGAGAGALSGALSDYGINDEFIKSLGKELEPDASALFVLVRKVTVDRVLPELQPFGGKVIRTSLTLEQEKRLQAELQKLGASAAPA
jgi:uncharacterized membrane protein